MHGKGLVQHLVNRCALHSFHFLSHLPDCALSCEMNPMSVELPSLLLALAPLCIKEKAVLGAVLGSIVLEAMFVWMMSISDSYYDRRSE